MKQVLIQSLVSQLKEVYQELPWIDESFSKKLKSINEENAFIRPQPDIHSVAEIISHLVVWRFEVISRLQGNPRKLYEESPENWKSNDELRKDSWDGLLENFQQTQNELLTLLQSKDDSFLDNPYLDRDYKYLADGLLHHDLYHLGQIGLVNKMLTSKKPN